MRNKKEWLSDARIIYDFLSGESAAADIKADMILALGSHDRRVPDFAAGLYHAGAAPLVVCAGGLGRITQDIWDEPEAEIFGRRCLEPGVPASHLLLECNSTNTGENFLFSKKLLEEREVVPQSGLIVCKPYMNLRAIATGRKQWPEVNWTVGTPQLSFEEYFPGGPPEQEVTIMVGDLYRLRVYAERGFQTPVDVPDEIWETGNRLRSDGFDRQIV